MSEEINRVSTGINGLDELIEGGFVERSSTLVTGFTGTGKTIFSAQYLWQGLKEGDKCMFVTFEEKPISIKGLFSDFGWDFHSYAEEDKFRVIFKDPFDATSGEDFFRFRNELAEYDMDRIAIDSVSILSLYYDEAYKIRKNLFKLVEMLGNTGATSVLTAEAPKSGDQLTRYGVEEFLVDGVISLHLELVGPEAGRTLAVRKMRRTDFEADMHPIEIDDNGMSVRSL